MSIHFLRGDAQAPRGHAIFVARSTSNPRTVYCTYCIVPPIPMSLAKYLPPMFAAQISPEDLGEAGNSMKGMPIPPMLEEGKTMEQLELLAERRGDDLCDIGTVSSEDQGIRLQMAAMSCEEYGQLYEKYISSFGTLSSSSSPFEISGSDVERPLDDVDADEILLQSMSDRQRLAELGKLVGMARYALDGHDSAELRESQRRMQRIADLLAEKYRGSQLVTAAIDPNPQGAQLAGLYLSRAYKLLDEEYAEIPTIERAIKELQE